jgi:hypothetical protein
VSPRAWKIYSSCGLALCAAYYVVPHVALHPIYDVVGLSSVVAVVVGVIRNKPAFRWPWILLALGQLGFVVGDMIRAFYEEILKITSPFPGPADVAYLAAYPIMAAALILFVRSRDRAKDRAGLIDTMIIVTGVGLISWIYLIVPYTNTPDIRAITSANRITVGITVLAAGSALPRTISRMRTPGASSDAAVNSARRWREIEISRLPSEVVMSTIDGCRAAAPQAMYETSQPRSTMLPGW